MADAQANAADRTLCPVPVLFVDESNDSLALTMSVLKKVSCANVKKWVKVPMEIGSSIEYKDFIAAIKTKFGFAESVNLLLQDLDGVEIDEDVFPFFSTRDEFSVINIGTATATTVKNPGNENTQETDSLDNLQFDLKRSIEANTDEIIHVSLAKQKFVISSLKQALLENPGGDEILNEYKRNSTLTIPSRRQLVNIAVDNLVKFCGNYPSRDEKIQCAESIIEEFPSLKDPMSTKGYEAFYDPISRSGYILWRLKTLNRSKAENNDKNHSRVETNSVLQPEKTNANETNPDPKVLKEKLNFMQSACKKSQRNEIIEILKYSSALRRNEPQKIIENFPRFLDIPYLIREDFCIMHPGVKKIDFIEERIIEIAKQNLKRKLNQEEQGWDLVTQAHIYLFKLLPSTNRGRKSSDKSKSSNVDNSSVNQMIVFHQNGIPFDDLQITSSQPFLIAVGINKTAIISYYIGLEGHKIPIDAILPSEAFDILFKAHFVFDTEFHASLKVMFQFLQIHYYRMDSKIKLSAKMREVRTWLTMDSQINETD